MSAGSPAIALGTLPQGETTLIAGTGSQTGANRWGDYSMMGTDPTDDCTFWYTQEYVQTTGSNTWKTRIGSFKFPSCTAPGHRAPSWARSPRAAAGCPCRACACKWAPRSKR